MKRSSCVFSLAVVFVLLPVFARAGSSGKALNNASTFFTGNSFAVGTLPASIAVGDFNNDGKMDIVTGNYGDSSIAVLLSLGNGEFSTPTFYLTENLPNAVAVADFNNDGNLDIAVASGVGISMFLGNGDGTFRIGGTYATGTPPLYLAVGDVNGDGNLDIVFSSAFQAGEILGNGDGTFGTFTEIEAEYSGPVVLGDFNGDGNLDIALGNSNTNYSVLQLFVYLGNGNGTFGKPIGTKFLEDYFVPSSIVAGDFNNDGNLDVAVGSNANGGNQILVSLGDGTGHLRQFHYITTGLTPASLVAAYVDGDKNLDLIVANTADEDITVLLNDGKAAFTAGSIYAAGAGIFPSPTLSLAAGDFTGTGKQDIAVANPVSNNVTVLLGNGGGKLNGARQFQVGTEGSTESGPVFVTAGDFNGDGKQDVVSNTDLSGLFISFGNGDGTFQAPVFIATKVFGPIVAVDLNGDGYLDLVAYPIESNSVAVMLNNGDGTFQAPVSYFCGNPPNVAAGDVVAGDFNHDGKPDLAISIEGFVSILLGNGDGTFQYPQPFLAGTQPQGLVVGDFNGDGQLDIAAADSGAEDIAVIFGKGDGTFGQAELIPVTGQVVLSVAAGYFHGEGKGKLDLVAVYPFAQGSVNTSLVDVFLNNGDGTFKALQTYPVGALDNGTISLAVADFNLDGNQDIALQADGNIATVLFGNGKGGFTVTTFGYGGSLFSDTVVADFNGDHKPDLAIANGTQAFTILLNQTK